jgi:homoserine dehydrogenase
VRFAELTRDDPLFDLPDASNAAVLLGPEGPLERPAGCGAGRWPTAESILGDLLELARDRSAPVATDGVGGRYCLGSDSSDP